MDPSCSSRPGSRERRDPQADEGKTGGSFESRTDDPAPAACRS